jgi:hypothetical protein
LSFGANYLKKRYNGTDPQFESLLWEWDWLKI